MSWWPALAPAMASSDFIDPYLDPESGLLRNKVGAQTKSALDDAEGALSFARLVQLMDHPVKPTGDLDELRAIHRHLFQDVYAFAGELRTVDIRKNEEGAQFFLPVSMIERAAMFAAGELRGTRRTTPPSAEPRGGRGGRGGRGDDGDPDRGGRGRGIGGR